MFEVPNHPHGTGLVVQHHHSARTQTAAGFLYVGIVHRRVQMFFDEKIRRCSAGKNSAKAKPVEHAAGVVLNDLSHGRAHGQFPKSGAVDLSAHSVKFGAGIRSAAQAAKPVGAVVHDVMNIAEGLDVLHDGRLPP